jgi:hypothetical protein
MTITELQRIIQHLCVTHPDIKAFNTGRNAQQNDAINEYPHARLIHPFDMVIDAVGNRVVNFTVKVRTNERTSAAGITQHFNHSTTKQDLNENTSLALENELRGLVWGIGSDLVTWLRLYLEQYENGENVLATIKGAERTERDYTTGVDIYFTVDMSNSQDCETETQFNTLVTQLTTP